MFLTKRNLKKVAEILLKKYNGDVPSTPEGFLELPGVGEKMTQMMMQVCWNKYTH
jgi:endonuclease-3